MKYSNQQLDELKRTVPMYKLAVGRVPNLTDEGSTWKGCCPFHDDSTPSFNIRLEQDGIWMFHCFGGSCGKKGNVFQLVQWVDKISFEEAVDKVAVFAWGEVKDAVKKTFGGVVQPKKLVSFPLSNMKGLEKALEDSPEARAWLVGRGISLETAKQFHLGYNKSCEMINPHHPWVRDGWIVFPTISDETITLLKYRSVKGKKTPDGKTAILRGTDMATSLFNTSAVSPFDDVFIVEGECDAMVLSQAGYAAVSLQNSTHIISPEERDLIMGTNARFLAGDMDAAGETAMNKLWSELRDATYRVKWPEGCKDANDAFLKACGGDVVKFQALIEKLKGEARGTPLPFIHDMAQSMRDMDDTKPLDNPRRLRFPRNWSGMDEWVAIVPGDMMCMFATESKTGKTTWLMNILLENALQGKVIVNYSAELLPAQYSRRAISYLTLQNRNNLEPEHKIKAADMLQDAKFYNGYKPGADWREVIELLKAAKRRLGADILVLDHLHFLTRGEKDEIKAQSEALRALKDIAVEFNCIVIVVGQPRKAQSNQRGREAVTQDAKGSEAFGSDASAVFILHRKRLSEGDDSRGMQPVFDPVTKVKLDYSRESETRSTLLYFRGEICRFEAHTGAHQ